MIESTNKFKVHDIVYNRDRFAIARGYWDGRPALSLACRWHDEDGIGYPQTFGKPQWMLLPEDVGVEITSTLEPSESSVVVTFRPQSASVSG
jgi:hypothetical protein